jgi:hypothetical protein
MNQQVASDFLIRSTLKRITLLTAVFALVASCDNKGNYELSKDSEGRVIRMDKRTGEIAVISGGQLVPIKTEEEVRKEKNERLARLEIKKNWTSIDVPQLGVRTTLATAWRDGMTLYQLKLVDLESTKAFDEWIKAGAKVEAAPVIDQKEVASRLLQIAKHLPLTLKFFDAGGFVIAEETVPPLTRIVDTNGQTGAFSIDSSVPLSDVQYEKMNNWNVYWR